MKDPRVDAYIRRSAEFARPILTRIRAIVHTTCPDVEETLKWGMPTFMYHAAGIRRMDHRGENRSDTHETHCHLGRLDCRRKVSQLEIPGQLTVR